MSLTSLSFFIFLLITVFLFYIVKPAQKYILLAASLYFYVAISANNKIHLALLIAAVGLITYLGAILIEKATGILKNILLTGCIGGLAILLIVLKYVYNVLTAVSHLFHASADFSWLQFGAVIGLSYYVLSAIGYLVDVYWGNHQAERNIADVFLFIFYFPQLISGPLTRFGAMQPQFCERRAFDVDRFLSGIRRMAWGYFKKLVISERFAMAVPTIYGHYTDYSLLGIIGATLCYAVQLYTDFSGCMDIIMGASMLFGVELPENFQAPFFSETIQEFWQRWHITLGVWFKDYLMYPLQKSRGMQKIGKWSKQKLGKKTGKKTPFYLSMLVLWVLIGLWHGGTGYYFLASAGIPCVLLIGSDLCLPFFKMLTARLRIQTNCQSWMWFRRARTLLLICLCWIVVCSGSLSGFATIMKHALLHIWNYSALDAVTQTIGWTSVDIILMAVGLIVLYLADLATYRGSSIFKVMDRQNYFMKLSVIYLEVMTIFLHGMVGTSSFIYFRF